MDKSQRERARRQKQQQKEQRRASMRFNTRNAPAKVAKT
jgi:hypothetical protein